MAIFIQVVLPVLFIFSAGFALQKWKQLDIKSISMVSVYILIPSLVFRTFYKAELDKQYVMMLIFSAILLYALIFLTIFYSRLKKYPPSVESGLILSTAFMNAGNYGAPIVLFAFGEAGFAYSVSFLVIQAIIMNFYGVYYAAKGKEGIVFALKAVLAMPATYATLIALLVNILSIPVPSNISSAIDLVADATIPFAMLVLGMQLAQIKLKYLSVSKIAFGTVMRLLISPLIAFGIVQLLPMDPLLAKVLIVSAAMPSAVTTTMYAIQFDSEPELISSITMVTTFISVFTVTVLLTFLTV